MSEAIDHAGVIEQISTLLQGQYVFPELAEQMSAMLRERLAAYSKLDDRDTFAQTVTTDLQSICNDKHVRFRHDPAAAAMAALQDYEDDVSDEWLQSLANDNFGFYRVEWLPGRIGYFDTRMFPPVVVAGDTAVAAMNFLANSKAIIFDLRKNGGGDPQMVQLIASYLYPTDIRHMSSIYLRPNDSYLHFWTLPYVPGKRMPDIDVYVLTSSFTFSGAEEFAYNMKAHERGTIIGETTRGGANPGRPYAVAEVFTLFVPNGRAINPVTNTNWEGVGVVPHIQVPADDALKVAHKLALEKLLEKAKDEVERKGLEKALENLKS